jgi:Flp pilus assembly protein TadG
MVILMPALFAVMFLGMQAALIYHARTIAIASAQEGARAAGAENGTATAGVSPPATSYVTDTAGDALTSPPSPAPAPPPPRR